LYYERSSLILPVRVVFVCFRWFSDALLRSVVVAIARISVTLARRQTFIARYRGSA
jgi:hypothetical protein